MVIIDDEDDLVESQPIERRGEPRGVFPGLKARIVAGAGAGVDYDVAEASRVGFFLKMSHPDLLPLGHTMPIQLSFRGATLVLDGEVVRKETDPRRGMAIRIAAFGDPESEGWYQSILTGSGSGG